MKKRKKKLACSRLALLMTSDIIYYMGQFLSHVVNPNTSASLYWCNYGITVLQSYMIGIIILGGISVNAVL